MDAAGIASALRDDAVGLVFVNVLLQQLGLPVPAVPTLLVAGSVASAPAAAMLAAAVVASVVADALWYLVGRALGYRVLSGLCRLSINPASCVTGTEARFARWGVWSLVVAKFVPGFSTVAPPIAGTLRMSLPSFLAAAAIGAAAWAGAAILAGRLLREHIAGALAVVSANRPLAVVALLTGVAVWLGWKVRQRVLFERSAAIPQITPDELLRALASSRPPLLLDLRGAAMVAELGPIPGATVGSHDDLPAAVGSWPKGAPIVTLCACPEDAGAVQAAQALLRRGYRSVRPLRGGWEAWRRAVAAAAAD
ncbi:VTT domain-containing protein [Accumulibacter sp.]|uniref:VTT domain-containing protein n=1 Tax=Accumulibacter sp. TaxID=2053492 RepID=UPI0025DE4F02|nr:VTT domain-containing protein [Accumulibacter sp.]MCM8595765.1 VTT domain-containing protein [Accumulibacter sp.]MCM8626486.1 VTT domain-containing protein [Accumulibacter sp.]MDS4049913.1 VTT domain-containing protein [Accumulibacter sp.]